MAPFALETETQGNRSTVRLSGQLDVVSAAQLRDEVSSLISGGVSQLTFDCSLVDFTDSTGLGVLVGARARALAINGSVELVGVKPAMRRVLAVTGIESLFASAA